MRDAAVVLHGQSENGAQQKSGTAAEPSSWLSSEDGPQLLNPIHDLPLTSYGLGLLG